MDWLQLHLVAPAATVPALEDALLAAGAVSVGLGETGPTPVLEPGVGEMPLWEQVAVSALFESGASPGEILGSLRATLGELPGPPRWEVLADRAWEREWLQHFRPLRCGRRLWVCPGGQEVDAADAVVLRLDPGLAFGTGTHPSTALCLEWLDANPPAAGARVVDYGCGSGILGIAALLLGAGHVSAVDIDPQALLATADNAGRNAIAPGRIAVSAPEALGAEACADLVLANILAGPLVALAPRLAALVRPGGQLVLAGLLESQSADVGAAYTPWFEPPEVALREGWARLALRRRAGAAA